MSPVLTNVRKLTNLISQSRQSMSTTTHLARYHTMSYIICNCCIKSRVGGTLLDPPKLEGVSPRAEVNRSHASGAHVIWDKPDQARNTQETGSSVHIIIFYIYNKLL